MRYAEWTLPKEFDPFILIVNVVRTEWRLRVMLYLAVAVTVLLCLLAINDYRLGNLGAEGYRIVLTLLPLKSAVIGWLPTR